MSSGNPNDQIRGVLLQWLFDVHSRSRSPKSASVNNSKVTSALKASHGYKQAQVSSNLDYLVQEGYVVEQRSDRSYTSPSGAEYSSEKITYKISSAGIKRLEKASLYRAPNPGSQVNISNVQGVVVVGEGNVVNSTYTEAAKVLSELRQAVAEDQTASSADKVSALSDLDAMAMQMQKPAPNPKVLEMLWTSAKSLATVNGAATLVQHLDHLFNGAKW